MNKRIVVIFFSLIGINSLDAENQLSVQELYSQGTTCYYEQQFDKARSYFEEALALENNNPLTHFNLGYLYSLNHDWDKALEHYNHAIEYMPDYAKAHFHKGIALQKKQLFSQAFEALTQALQHKPNYFECWAELIRFHFKQHNISSAIEAFNYAKSLEPNNIGFLFDCGHNFVIHHQLDLALLSFQEILRISPEHVDAMYNCAYVLRLQGKDDQAIPLYEKVIKIYPQYPGAHLGLAKAYLATGNLKQGWKEFEWRWPDAQDYTSKAGYHNISLEQLKGKKIFLRAEWGLGDTMQFIRYAKLLKDLDTTIIVQTFEPLIPLFKLCPYLDFVVPVGNIPPQFDLQIPLLSLPLLFDTQIDTIPAPIPYLFADQTLIKNWESFFAADPNFKIGICWQGKPDIFLEDHPTTKRSISLSQFLPLAEIPGISLYSLQQQHGLEQLNELGPNYHIKTFTSDFDQSHGRYMDTAAAMHYLDLIISIDTSIIHLAGALGKTVWVLLPKVAEWRWLQDRNDTPWYPGMKLFRQSITGDWSTVIKEIYNQVITIIAEKNKKEIL